jgi:hypothetical protein
MTASIHPLASSPRIGSCRRVVVPSARRGHGVRSLGVGPSCVASAIAGADRSLQAGFSVMVRTP